MPVHTLDVVKWLQTNLAFKAVRFLRWNGVDRRGSHTLASFEKPLNVCPGIYNINKGSLKDAIVSLGGFCTAEVISNQGLILTNHHCGFDAVQNHSSLEHNYIRDGFWAYNKNQELQNQGLFVSFIISIDEVTNSIMKDINSNMTEKERQSVIDKNIAQLKKDYKNV